MRAFNLLSICSICVAIILSCFCNVADAKVLFLAHWNDSLTADIAAGDAAPAVVSKKPPPLTSGGGYAYTNSMPALGGLTIRKGAALMYRSAGNIKADQGSIAIWIKLLHDFKAGPEQQVVFSLQPGPGKNDTWSNTMYLRYGG